MLFGNNGRPSNADKERKIKASHIEAESNQTYTRKFVYVGDCKRVKNAVFNNCKVVIEETAHLRGCVFSNCVIEKGIYSVRNFDKSLSKNNRNHFQNCLSLDAKAYEVGLDADMLNNLYGREIGQPLRHAAYKGDLQTVLVQSTLLDIDIKYKRHTHLIEIDDDEYRRADWEKRKAILESL